MADRRARNIWVAVLTLTTLVLAALTVYVGTRTPPNLLGASLLQAMTLAVGVVTPYVFAKYSDANASSEILKSHAKPAFRRTRNIYKGLGLLSSQIQLSFGRLEQLTQQANGQEYIEYEHVRSVMYSLEYALNALIETADDVLRDWHDLVPDEVDAIMREVESRESGGSND